MKTFLTRALVLLSLACGAAGAAEPPLLLDHPGAFSLLERSDYASPRCGFSAPEMTEGLARLRRVVAVLRRHPVLADIRGFEGRARLHNIGCDDPDGYGVPVRLSLEFSAWFVNRQGRAVSSDIEPPSFSLLVNKPRAYALASFEPDKTWFTMPGQRQTLASGIDLYGDDIVILYNPRRPPYHLPLSVGEALGKLRAYWSRPNANDAFTARQFLAMVEAEYAATPRADLEQPAHDKGGIGAVADPALPSIVRVNPEYWDRSLPRGAVQIIGLRVSRDAPALQARREQAQRQNNASLHLYRFEEGLDLDLLRALQALLEQR
jgi:hypothetical protein